MRMTHRGRGTCRECSKRRLLSQLRHFRGLGYLCKACIRREEEAQRPFKRWRYMIFPLVGSKVTASSPDFGGWSVKGTVKDTLIDRVHIEGTLPSLIGGFRVLFSDIDTVNGHGVKGIEQDEKLWNWYNHVRPYKGAKVTMPVSADEDVVDVGTIEEYYGQNILVRLPWGLDIYDYTEITIFDGKRVADILLNEESL